MFSGCEASDTACTSYEFRKITWILYLVTGVLDFWFNMKYYIFLNKFSDQSHHQPVASGVLKSLWRDWRVWFATIKLVNSARWFV